MTGTLRSVSQIKSIFIVTTIFLVGLSVYSFLLFESLYKASRQIHQIHNVKSTLATISAALWRAESNTRGYMLSGDASLLERQVQALQSIEQSLEVLDSLVAGDTLMMHGLQSFNLAVDDKIRSILDYTTSGVSPSDASTHQAWMMEGIRRVDNVEKGLSTLVNKETFMVDRRTQLFSRLSVMAPVYIIVLFLGALFILLYSYIKVNAGLAKSKDLHHALVRQSISKESLSAELISTNKALAFQNVEKGKRAAELSVANDELAYQNIQKENRAAELIVANKELAFQNEEKEKRAIELLSANKELELFLNISSHDLQEPLRKIQMASSRIEQSDYQALSAQGRSQFDKMKEGALSMQTLLEDLLSYAGANTAVRNFEEVDIETAIQEVRADLKEIIDEKNATIVVKAYGRIKVIRFQFRQLLNNIISNALKFSIPGKAPRISISAAILPGSECHYEKLDSGKEYCHLQITDDGIGFDPKYSEKIFEVFQRLSGKDTYKGTGIGLAIVKRIVDNHHGVVTATGRINEGATFDIYLPTFNITLHA